MRLQTKMAKLMIETMKPRLSLANVANRVHDVVALAPPRREIEDDLRRILQVRVHHNHSVPGRKVDPGCEGDLVTEVAREPNRAETTVSIRGLQHQLVRAI